MPRAFNPWVDGTAGLAVLLCASLWGAVSWQRVDNGRGARFYQLYFEPAVMIACGKGFVVAQPQIPAMAAFLQERVDRFSCEAIPADAKLGTDALFQGAWRYLMYAVGLNWRVVGVSWSGLGPLFGVLFGTTILAAYAIFRLGMAPALAVPGAFMLGVSRLHLSELPNLRDYAKAPFTLVLVFLLGLLVKRRPSRANVLAVAGAYGAVVGLGYGFRTDFLVNIPLFFATLFGFLEGGVFRNIQLKSAAAAVCAASFLLTAWPIVSTVYTAGGCQWHTALLGLSSDFSDPLGVQAAPYELSRAYQDDYVYVTATSYAARVEPGIGHIEFCQPGYDRATGRYLAALVTHFPADMVVRAYGSALRVVELPGKWAREAQALAGAAPPPNRRRPEEGWVGIVVVTAAIALASMAGVRLGFFLVFFVLYTCGYPAIQFAVRHYFHLEFVTWWAAGFVLQQVAVRAWPLVRGSRTTPVPAGGLWRAGLVLATSAAALTLTLWVARLYQQQVVRSVFRGYLASAREDVPVEPAAPGTWRLARATPRTDPETAELVEVDLSTWRCGPHPAMAFNYGTGARQAFSRTFAVPHDDDVRTPTRIFMPVYDGLLSIDSADAPDGCVDGVYRLRDASRFPLLLEAVLRPRWEDRPLYQQLREQQFGRVGFPEAKAVP